MDHSYDSTSGIVKNRIPAHYCRINSRNETELAEVRAMCKALYLAENWSRGTVLFCPNCKLIIEYASDNQMQINLGKIVIFWM